MKPKKDTEVLVTNALKVSTAGFFCVSAFCSVIFVSYFLGAEWIFRPIANGPSTHPMTAVLLFLLACSGLLLKRTLKWALVVLIISCVFLLLSLQQLVTGWDVVDSVMSLSSVFDQLLHQDAPMTMGSNTVYMLALVAVAQLLMYQQRLCLVAQILAVFSAFLPFISAVGYLYQVDGFHGQMSPTTTTLGLLLSFSLILSQGKWGVIHALLAPSFGASLVRWQLMIGVTIFVVSGYFVTHVQHEEKFISLYVAVISFSFILIMLVSAVSYERYDKQRRSLEKELVVSATTDRLTSVYNRLALDKDISVQFKKPSIDRMNVSVLIVDVDYFKKFNDTYGHLIGDKVLQTVAQILKSNVRSTDTVYRYGGEEFVVLLMQCDLNKAVQIAEHLRKHVAAQDLSSILSMSTSARITVSIGCSNLCQSSSIDGVLKLADDALYKAKQNGRNQVCFSHAELFSKANLTLV